MQMTTFSVPTVGPASPGTTFGRTDDAIRSICSSHIGAARPGYATTVGEGLVWVKTVSSTVHEVYYWDGDQDILLFTINPTSGAITLGSAVLVNSGNVGPTLISGVTSTTPADGDLILFGDVSNSSVPRQSALSNFWSLLLGAARSVTALWTFTTAKMVELTLTDGATINWDTATGHFAKVTLGGNRTLAAPTNLQTGAVYTIWIIQDGTGSRTLTWNSVFKFKAATAPTLTTTAAKRDSFSFRSDGTNLYECGRTLAL